MGKGIVVKIIEGHRRDGSLVPGEDVAVAVDQTLLNDSNSTMALSQFEYLDIKRSSDKLAVFYVDHNTLQTGFENMDDHRFIEAASRKLGIHFSRPGNGIGHQVHLERFSAPGQVLLGADSHTTTGGGAGMLAIGAGGMDVVNVTMTGTPFAFVMPKVVRISLVGQLPAWSSAKDVALEVVRRVTCSGGRGKVLEFGGEGVASLSVTERATIANMCIETGALTGIFPSDEMTRRYLRAQSREADWRELSADADATYDEEMTIDLSSLPPLIARPHLPDNVVPVTDEVGRKVDQVAIGSCTNSSLQDMLKVAEILKRGRVPSGVSLVIAPGSRQVLLELMERGALADMVRAGARVLETACGPCNGIGQAPSSGGISLRTFNRNFKGRSSTADAQVYLVSPETAAASALAGVVTDPRTLGESIRITLPERFVVDDAMLEMPAAVNSKEPVVVPRGPNIVPLPLFEPLGETLEGKALAKLGDNVTTDDILPGGAKSLSLRSNVPALSDYVLSRVLPNFVKEIRADGGGFILGGKNYGQGSSREHAALAPRYLGVRAVIVVSFARIHKANLVNAGILPLEFSDEADLARFEVGDRLRLADTAECVRAGRPLVVENLTQGFSVETHLNVSDREREFLIQGGLLSSIALEGKA